MTIIYDAYSGARIDVFDPKVEDVRYDDIVLNLSRSMRYNGGTDPNRLGYSVLEHSIHMYDHATKTGLSPELRAFALFHDAPEYVFSDMITPIKRHTFVVKPDGESVHKFGELEDKMFSVISRAMYPGLSVGLNKDNSVSSTKWAVVKELDMRIVVDEWVQLKLNSPMPAKLMSLEPLGVQIRCWDEVTTRQKFFERYEETRRCLSLTVP